MVDQCEMVVGFLVPHRCENPALGKCGKCGRVYCEEHVTVTPKGMLCVACQQGLDQPVALAATAQTFNPADIALFSAATRDWDQDADLSSETFSDLS